MDDSFSRSVFGGTANLLSVHVALLWKQQTPGEPLQKGELQPKARGGAAKGKVLGGTSDNGQQIMIGAPVRHIAGQVGAEVVHVLVRTDPSRACSRLLASILGLHFICVSAGLRPRETCVYFLTIWLLEQQAASSKSDDTIHLARIACREFQVPRPFRVFSHFPASSLSTSPSASPCGVLGLVLSTLCATSYSRCLPALPACCAYYDYQTWSS